MTGPLAPRGGPDLTILPGPPPQQPDWVVHPHPCWLSLRTSAEESSAIVSHVSNIEFVRWIDHASERALAEAGWSYQDLLEQNAMFFVARHEIDYRQEAFFGEALFMATWVRDIRRVKSWRDSIIWRLQDDVPMVICTASTLWVHVDLETRRPSRIPSDMNQALAPLQDIDPPWRARA